MQPTSTATGSSLSRSNPPRCAPPASASKTSRTAPASTGRPSGTGRKLRAFHAYLNDLRADAQSQTAEGIAAMGRRGARRRERAVDLGSALAAAALVVIGGALGLGWVALAAIDSPDPDRLVVGDAMPTGEPGPSAADRDRQRDVAAYDGRVSPDEIAGYAPDIELGPDAARFNKTGAPRSGGAPAKDPSGTTARRGRPSARRRGRSGPFRDPRSTRQPSTRWSGGSRTIRTRRGWRRRRRTGRGGR